MKDISEKASEPEMEGLLRGPSIELSPLVMQQINTEDAAFPPISPSKSVKQKSTPVPYLQVALVALFKGSQVRRS